MTFEKDIENEIRTKSASLSDIAAASGVVDNKPEKSAFHLVIVVVIALVILVVGVLTYLYYKNIERANTPKDGASVKERETVDVFERKDAKGEGKEQGETNTSNKNPRNWASSLATKKLVTSPLSDLLPTIFPYIQKNLVKAETYESAYIITFTGYNEFYKTLLDNEELFLKDALALYGETVASSTIFTDKRLGEMDTRFANGTGGKSVYYLFVRPSLLIISDNGETLESISTSITK